MSEDALYQKLRQIALTLGIDVEDMCYDTPTSRKITQEQELVILWRSISNQKDRDRAKDFIRDLTRSI